jgi:formylglycine-generating enzyme required for sulfatase activity/pimeloyl-ACP methyl ester carboxylesterase
VVESTRAVFVSYASQDADAAIRICTALRAADIEVWFDQSELRGGEAWDASIRRQVKSCRLFLPVISANTQAREEGYFRREWNLAVSRTLDMADDAAFVLPVVIDSTRDMEARVPEKFREVQWTRAPAGETPAAFVERVRALLYGAAGVTDVSPRKGAEPKVSVAPEPRAPKKVPVTSRSPAFPSFKILAFALPVLVVIIAAVTLIPAWQKREHARTVLLPELQDKVSTMSRSDSQIFEQAVEIEDDLPRDPTLAKLWPSIANTLTVDTDPATAQVFWKDYDTPGAAWRSAGTTPLKEVKVPRTFLRLEVRKAGYQTIELAVPRLFPYAPITQRLKLDPVGSLPEKMVRIPPSTTNMDVVGLETYGPKGVPEFLVDKFEVTNKQFKAFVDAGGYKDQKYWTIPIVKDGKPLSLKDTLATFVDRTGRPGPSTWEAGSYPDGTENHPVTGVSWFEAAAYAAFVHKELPTVFHWAVIADTSRSDYLLPVSNFSGKSTTPVGSLANLSTFGVYDLAGNAREWLYNQSSGSDQRFILGGGWTDPSYSFNDSFTQPALDRSESNGFRCIKELTDRSADSSLKQSIAMAFRDYSKEQPVNDAAFASFARQFIYDKTPLGASLQKTLMTDAWKEELVSIDAGYSNERMVLHVFLPISYSGPLQPVVFFPGSGGIHEDTFDSSVVSRRLLFIIKSGRALIFPIYKGTYERRDDLKSDVGDMSVRYKDHVIMWVKEYSRTIDYLETRKDMQADKVAYLGISWGGYMGGIIPAIEKRIKVVVLNVGGMVMDKSLPEVDQINYLPRVRQPVLMLNGTYDMYFPVETSQKPMFRFLGTADNQKKMIVYASGHVVPQTDFIKETLAWLDAYLGPDH